MDREQIIRMAREAGFDPHDMSDDFTCNLMDIERFAALVAAHEREAIAQSLDKQADLACDEIDKQWAQEMAAAVRARGEKI
jgi:hypothetical protein